MATGLLTDPGSDSPARRLAREVSTLQASLLGKLRSRWAAATPRSSPTAARQLAEEFGSVTATAVGAVCDRAHAAQEHDPLSSLFRPGQMRRRLDQLIEINKRYGHPFGLVVFDARGPGTRSGVGGRWPGDGARRGRRGAARQHPPRRRAFRLEEDAICVLAPNLTHGRRACRWRSGCWACSTSWRRRGAADHGFGRRRRLPRARGRRRRAAAEGRRGDVAGARGGPAGGRRCVGALQDR